MNDLEYQEFHFLFRGQDIQWPEALTLRNAIGVCRQYKIEMDIAPEEESALVKAIEHHEACIDAWYIAKYGHRPMFGS